MHLLCGVGFVLLNPHALCSSPESSSVLNDQRVSHSSCSSAHYSIRLWSPNQALAGHIGGSGPLILTSDTRHLLLFACSSSAIACFICRWVLLPWGQPSAN